MTKAHVIDGKALADTILQELKEKIEKLAHGRPPGLATVLVGNDKASAIYVANKRKKALELGIEIFHHELDENASLKSILALIDKLNKDKNVDAILVQLPLPRPMDAQAVMEAIDVNKDVDGFHPLNVGHLFLGSSKIVPCTPLGILHLIHAMNFSLQGKHAVVIGRSNIVGKPVAELLLQEHATVSICHSHTKDLRFITKQADLLIVAIGQPKFIDRSYVKQGCFVIDVGINRDENNQLCGDVDFFDVLEIASYITPVPGGVGPLTIAMLLKNTWDNFMRLSS